MPLVDFSDEDLLRGKIVTPAWYRMRIKEINEALSKDQKSTNWLTEGIIVRNADDGSEEFANVPIVWNFNSKARGFLVGFLSALGITVEAGKRYDLSKLAGMELDVFVENELYENRMVNRVNHKYRAVQEQQGT